MSSWNINDKIADLSITGEASAAGGGWGAPETTATTSSTPFDGAATGKTPQEHGWTTKIKYDYDTYNKSTKELSDAQGAISGGDEVDDAVGGVKPGDWASNAATYEWEDEFGDVGPRFPELEKQLFGSDNHVRRGINFQT